MNSEKVPRNLDEAYEQIESEVTRMLKLFHEKGTLGSKFPEQGVKCVAHAIIHMVLVFTSTGMGLKNIQTLLNSGRMSPELAKELAGALALNDAIDRYDELHQHQHELRKVDGLNARDQRELDQMIEDLLKKGGHDRRN